MQNVSHSEITFRFDGPAERVYLCLQPCEENIQSGVTAGPERRQVHRLTEIAPQSWSFPLRLSAGWWRFRYYTETRGCMVYAEPTEGVMSMDGLDALLHVRRTASTPGATQSMAPQRHGATPIYKANQSLCVFPEDGHAIVREVGSTQGRAVSSSEGSERPHHCDAPVAPDARRDPRRGHGEFRHVAEDLEFKGTQAEALWRHCAQASAQ
jgi:hypothetical protein